MILVTNAETRMSGCDGDRVRRQRAGIGAARRRDDHATDACGDRGTARDDVPALSTRAGASLGVSPPADERDLERLVGRGDARDRAAARVARLDVVLEDVRLGRCRRA